ncbi:MAG: ABC transporter substrate-binding protein [Eubacteriales bacterium]|nr:ABC transporter substrate-binding protein [Eubacteriales bacterium]
MKKVIVVVVVLALAAVLAIVLGNAGTADNAPAAPSTSPDTATMPPQKANGTVYYLNFKPEQAAQWEELARQYQAKTGALVTVVTAASGNYETTLRSEMEKADAPTLFQVNGPIGLRVWKEYCLDLKDTALYQHLKNEEFALKDGDAVLAVAYVIETYGLIYNKALLNRYCGMTDAVIASPDEINSFQTLKAVADDIQARRDELGVKGAFTSAGLDSSSDWRFKTHLANLPVYYEYKAEGIDSTAAIKGTYLDGYKKIFDLYITDATCAPSLLGAKTMEDALAEFTLGEAVFFQNGTWAYADCIAAGMKDEDLGMLPIYIGAEGEEQQGLCTGSENYWCINKKAKQGNIEATKAFLEWVITSDEGREMLANEMGFVTPFRTFDEGYAATNALLKDADRFIADGKTPVSWTFTTMPSEEWKNGVGAALLEYAQGAQPWSTVEAAFVEGWAKESAAVGQP